MKTPCQLSLLSILLILALSVKGQRQAAITVQLSEVDSLFSGEYTVKWWTEPLGLSYSDQLPSGVLRYLIKPNQSAVFTIPTLTAVAYFSLSVRQSGYTKPILYYYLIEPGDNIQLTFSATVNPDFEHQYTDGSPYFASITTFFGYTPLFKGIGAAKYTLRSQMDSIGYYSGRSGVLIDKQYAVGNAYERALDSMEARLDMCKGTVDESIWQRLHADAWGMNGVRLFQAWTMAIKPDSNGATTKGQDLGLLPERFKPLRSKLDDAYLLSPFFLEYVLVQIRHIAWLENDDSYGLLVERIKSHFSGDAKARVLLLALLCELNTSDDWQSCYPVVAPYIRSKAHQDIVRHLQRRYLENALLPDMEFTDKFGNRVDLSALKGKVVVLDFWYTGCSSCSFFFKNTLRSIEKLNKDKSVAFVSISVDKDKRTWYSSIEGNQYCSRESIHLYTSGGGFVHPTLEHFSIYSYPTLIVIKKDFKLAKIFRRPNTNATRALAPLIAELLQH